MSFNLSDSTGLPSQELLDFAKKSNQLDMVIIMAYPMSKKLCLNMKLEYSHSVICRRGNI